MKIAVFGSTGKTGREVVRQALDRGYMVTAYARNPQKLDMTHTNLSVVSGELSDRDTIKTAVQGTDCVISALGPYFQVRDTALSHGVENILLVMKDCGVNRLIQLSTISSPDPNDGKDFRAKMLVGMVKLHVVWIMLFANVSENKSWADRVVTAKNANSNPALSAIILYAAFFARPFVLCESFLCIGKRQLLLRRK